MDDLQYINVFPATGGYCGCQVLNLVINGWPSILAEVDRLNSIEFGFKPCYKWMTFNTMSLFSNLRELGRSFKPCYKWMTFNTKIIKC